MPNLPIKASQIKDYCLNRNNWPALGLLLVAIIWVAYKEWAVDFYSLDSHTWIRAGILFARAVAAHQWQQVLNPNVSAHPGVTVLWISAIIYWLKPLYATAVPPLVFSERLYLLHALVMLLVKLLILAWPIYFLKRYLDSRLLVAIMAYWLSERLLFGLYSTWLDQLLACLMVCALTWWVHITQQSIRKWQVVGVGWLFGLAILTKVIGWMLLPMLAVTSWPWLKQSPRRLIWIMVIGLVGVATYYALYPLAWVNPWQVLINRVQSPGMGDVSLGRSTGLNQVWLWEGVTLATIDLLFIPSMGYLAYLFYRSRRQLGLLWQNPLISLAMAGAFYSLAIMTIGIVLTDNWVGERAFFSPRYYTPAIILVSLPLFQLMWKRLTKRQFYLLIALLLALNMLISQAYIMPWAYHWLEN